MFTTFSQYNATQRLQSEPTMISKIKSLFSQLDIKTLLTILKVIIRIFNKPLSVYSWVQGGIDLSFYGGINNKPVVSRLGETLGNVGLVLSNWRK